MRKARYALAVVAPHPIQYMAGLWRTLARHPRIDLRVIYLDRVGLDGAIDPTMQAAMKWDVPLLDGYEHEFVRNLSPLRFTPIVHRINPGIRARLTASRYDAVILHGYLTLSNWIALPAARRRGIKVVYRGEGSMQGGDRHDSPLVNAVKRPLNRAFLRSCDAIACSSEDNRSYQISRGAPVDRLFSMPCAVDNDQLEIFAGSARSRRDVLASWGFPEEAKVALAVGRFTENKRIGDCIAALSAEPLRDRMDVHLAIAGDGPLRRDLEDQVRTAGLEGRVSFFGFLGQRAMAEAMLASDVFVLGSSHGDPSPKALSEALYLKCPVVCSQGVGTGSELVTPGQNGFVYPTGDVDALAGFVADVLADDERRLAMGRHSHEVARANDFSTGVESLIVRLDELMGEA